MIQMPEVRLKVLLDALLERLSNDYINATDKSLTVLNRMFGDFVVGNYNFLNQAIEIFVINNGRVNNIETRLLLDRDRAELPTIHVTMPSDQPYNDGLGLDPNNIGIGETPTQFYETYTRGYNSKFMMVITGSNTYQILMISYVLRVLLFNNVESLQANGFNNPKVYTQEVRLNQDIMPNAYVKAVVLDSFFDLQIPKFGQVDICNSISFEGTAKNE